MEIDLSQYGLSGAISHKLKTGLPTTVGDVTLNFDDSLDRLFAPRTTNTFNLEVSAPAMKGWLNGRRPAYGQQYPRGEHVAALDVKGYSDPSGIANLKGYIFSAISYTQTPDTTPYNPDDLQSITYQADFGNILPYQPTPALFRYNDSRDVVTIDSGVFDYFDRNWKLRFYANNACWYQDYCNVTIEFLDQANLVVAMLKTTKDNNPFRHKLEYGVSSNNLGTATQVGPYPNTDGELTFTNTGIVFTNKRTENYNSSFVINCDVDLIKKIRISNLFVDSSWTGGVCFSMAFLKII